ncbi:TPA: NTP transferase domain-containing protein [Candidatus Woesearchaeota archaeon]|nr:Nucleotidyl transferase [archaeon GW2011_AR15]MBS3104430.1 NTP transferase domain-containing protein [Candidatus Woesearchaeota archaeon]HIH41257.1 NTP transferase domain-containing protein [Candidatus Woesearchaeota archaeon]
MAKIKAIIPVAGIGTRLRPHTHTIPKALLHVAGKPILGHILDQVKELGIKEVILILGYLGEKIEAYAKKEHPGIKFHFAYQEKALGPGHAIYLAKPFVKDGDPLLIIYGDTIFVGDMKKCLKTKKDGAIAVKRVSDPRRFGVVRMKGDRVVDVVEKPDYVRPMDAMIGIYFMRNSKLLFDALDEMVETKRMTKGEFYLTDAFKIMLEKKASLTTFRMEGWFDCGKPETLLSTNRYLLGKKGNGKTKVVAENTVIIPPVFIGKKVMLKNSIIGPYVSIADGAIIKTSIIRDSIINRNAVIENAQLQESLIGENAIVQNIIEKLNVGDNSEISFNS